MTQQSTTKLAERLRSAVDRSGRKQSEIAAQAGIAAATLSRILTGRIAEPSFETTVAIIHALGESVGAVLGERGFALDANELKSLADFTDFLQRTVVRSAATAGIEPNARGSTRQGEVPSSWFARGARLIFRAEGDSMNGAGILHGDFLFVRPIRDLRGATGNIVVCRLGGATYVKQLEIDAGRIRLNSRNPRFAPIDVDEDDDFELIGIVVGRSGPPAV
jgi:transcriptional regulator with XRE-family HTH domain